MGKEEDLKTRLFRSIIEWIRMNNAEAIDKAYKYFWDEYSPDEFLTGTALALGFINFEDWLIFDYRVNEAKETFLDIYPREIKDLKSEELELIGNIKGSLLSLYEVLSVSKDKRVLIKDLLLGGGILPPGQGPYKGAGKRPSLRHKTPYPRRQQCYERVRLSIHPGQEKGRSRFRG